MREIIFRGIPVGGEDWIYGDLSHGAQTDIPYITERGVVAGERVDQSTIGEYTGLCDRNKKRGFEGDTVELEGSRGHILYAQGGFRIHWDLNKGFWSDDIINLQYCEITGSIHDTPAAKESK